VQLTASGASSFSWTPTGTLSDPAIADPIADPTSTTTYTVTGSDNGCTASQTVTVTVNNAPVVTLTPANPSVCGGGSVTLNAGGASSYSWSPTGGLSDPNIANPVATPSSTTTYTVTGTDNGCSASQAVTVDYIAAVSLSMSPASPSVCSGDSVQLTAGGATNYAWSPASGLSDAGIANPWAFPSGTTTYTLIGNVSNCYDTISVTVTVNTTPSISITPASPSICAGDSVQLSASGASSFSWSPATGLSSSSIANPWAFPTANTTYVVTGTTGSCSSTATVSVSVSPTPAVSVTPSSPAICQGDSVQLSASGATSYNWSPATGLSSAASASPYAFPSATTTYSLTGTTGACSGATLVTVTVNPLPAVTAVAADPSICEGTNVQLTASGASSYTWSPTTGLSDPNIANPTATPSVSTTYTVTGTQAGCSDSELVTISVNQAPDLNANVVTETCTGSNDASISLITTGGIPPYVFDWDNGENTQNIGSLVPGNYLVVVTDSNGCATTASYLVEGSDISCYEPHVYLPNVFSPNGDGNNDVLYMRGQGVESIHLIIYDRWGEKVFESSSLGDGWDGTFRGQPMNPGVFVFYMNGSFENGNPFKREGNISLVR
jgi:gliding motility-associated-like protein